MIAVGLGSSVCLASQIYLDAGERIDSEYPGRMGHARLGSAHANMKRVRDRKRQMKAVKY